MKDQQQDQPAPTPQAQVTVDVGDAISCPHCGGLCVRSGACYRCLNCGETSGCS